MSICNKHSPFWEIPDYVAASLIGKIMSVFELTTHPNLGRIGISAAGKRFQTASWLNVLIGNKPFFNIADLRPAKATPLQLTDSDTSQLAVEIGATAKSV